MSPSDNHTVDNMAANKNTDPAVTDQKELMTHDQMLFVMRILMYGVTPAISIVGVVGNTFSIIILLKHGLHKCSNILLISLAFADFTSLLGFSFSVPKILYEVVGIEFAWEYSEDGSTALYAFYNIFTFLDYAMGLVTFTMPMLITTERLIAVFLPFKFHLIVTPFRTWSIVAMVYLFWSGIIIYMQLWFTFTYSYNSEYNVTVGVMERTPLYKNNPESVAKLNEFMDYSVRKIPPAYTLAGCIAISVRIRRASAQRKKMKQTDTKEASARRTTKMLLAVCLVYIITCFVMSVPEYFPQLTSYTLINDVPTNFGHVLYQVSNLAICINSSSNFIVYVTMNKNFRDTYKSLFTACFRTKTGTGKDTVRKKGQK